MDIHIICKPYGKSYFNCPNKSFLECSFCERFIATIFNCVPWSRRTVR